MEDIPMIENCKFSCVPSGNMTKTEWEASIDAWKSLGYKVVIETYTP